MADWHRAVQVRQDGRGVPAGVGWAPAARLFGALIVLLGFTVLGTAGAAQAGQPRTVAGSAWTVEPTPNQNRASSGINELSAVSCTSKRACTAVGSHSASLSSPSFTLAERWNGTHWQIQRTIVPKGAKSNGFEGVSCTSATACTAVGSAFDKATRRSVNLAEVWNGKTWRIQSMPRPARHTQFSGVSCSAARACTAVGYQIAGNKDSRPFAESWNGTKWHVQA